MICWDGDTLLGEFRFETKGKDADDESPEPVWTGWREWVYYPGSFEPLAMVVTDTTNKDKA